MFRSKKTSEGGLDKNKNEKAQIEESVMKGRQVSRKGVCTHEGDCAGDAIKKMISEKLEACLAAIPKGGKSDSRAPLLGIHDGDQRVPFAETQPVHSAELETMCDTAHKLATVYNDTAGAIQAYSDILRQDEGHARALANLGSLHHCKGDFQQARTFYLRALRAQPNLSKTTYNLARLEHECGEHAAARSMYEAALLKLKGEDITACNALAYLGLLHQEVFGDLDAAQSCYARSLAILPSHAPTLDHCCALLVRLGQSDEARELHRLVCRIDASHM